MDINLKDAIYDKFIYDNKEYVVFNNRASANGKLQNYLVIGSVSIVDGKKEIEPIYYEDLYKEVAEYYLRLKSAYLKGE